MILSKLKRSLGTITAPINSKFLNACKLGRTEYISELLKDQSLDPGFNSNEAFREAVVKGQVEVVKLLLEDSRINPAAEANEGLRFACFLGHLEIVELLLKDSRVDPTAYDNEALKLAKQRGFMTIVKMLLKDPRVEMTEFSKDLGDKKKVSVTLYKGKPLVHIREYYTQDGQEKPGKGIALSINSWEALLQVIPQVQSAIDGASAGKSIKSKAIVEEDD